MSALQTSKLNRHILSNDFTSLNHQRSEKRVVYLGDSIHALSVRRLYPLPGKVQRASPAFRIGADLTVHRSGPDWVKRRVEPVPVCAEPAGVD